MLKDELNIGVIGAGCFARFAVNAFFQVPSIKIVAVTDSNASVAKQMGNEYNAEIYTDLENLLANTSIDLVYIATPPFLHYSQSKMALMAGKHVICEKPAALKTTEAKELQTLAKSLKLLYVINLMQRYNPLYAVIKSIVQEKMLGNFLHGFFENYASDVNLDEKHWFWDEAKSGGIFIEHGVHFFDMFQGWFGPGKILSAVQLKRPEIQTKIIDRVQATALFNKAVVTFYHAFDQPAILEKRELRLQFEKGEITLYEWIPVKMTLTCLMQNAQLEKLKNAIGDLSIVYHNNSSSSGQKVKGRFNDIFFDKHITIECGNVSEKQKRYQVMLTAMMLDQWLWIKDRNHIRNIDDNNAVESLSMAEHATELAQYI